MIVVTHGNRIIFSATGEWELVEKKLFINGSKTLAPVALEDIHEVPDQDLSHLYIENPVGDLEIRGVYPDDIPVKYTVEEKAQIIDRDTGTTINRVVHPTAGTDESIGTIRDMVVQIINAIGLAPTADFKRLNEIAIAAIAKGAAKKAVL